MNVWSLSNQGDASGKGRDPILLGSVLPNYESWKFCQGQLLDPKWVIDFRIQAEGDIEDMPWTDSRIYLASSRLRTLIESEFPGHAQFLRARVLDGDDREMLSFDYWAINWLYKIDCIDLQKSKYNVCDDSGEPSGKRYSFDRVVVDTARIPPSVHICRLLHYETRILVTEHGRRVLESSRVTGCQFYGIA